MLGGSYRPSNYEYLLTEEGDDYMAGTPGGQVRRFQAAGTLLLGDSVYLSGQSGTLYTAPGITAGYPTPYGAGATGLFFPPQVNKSAVLANYTASAMGIVVGGQSLMALNDPEIVQGPNYIGQTAALVNQIVFVMFDGVCWANGGIALTVGARVTASAITSGALTTVGYVAGNGIAMVLNTIAGAGAVLVQVRVQ